MRKSLILSLMAFVIGGLTLFAPAAYAQPPPTVCIRSQTAEVPAAALKNAIPAFQTGVDKLRRWWGGDKVLVRQGTCSWQLTIQPSSLGGLFAAGFHFLGPYGPYAVVFPSPTWTVTVSHELFEMVEDPYLTRTLQGTRLWLVEVADPVEALSFRAKGLKGYVDISDFVGPAWYDPTYKGKYLDYMGAVDSPEQVLQGGYVSYWNGSDYSQIFGGD